MDLEPSARTQELHQQLTDFIDRVVDPAEAVYAEQVRGVG